MRHRVDGNRLGRFSSLRAVTIRDIAKATLLHQRIKTTKARAKQAWRLVEKLISLGKKNTLAAKRRAFSVLCDHQLVSDLFNKIAVRFKNRIGGYTRILSLAERRGDNAFLVYLELTEKEIVEPKPKTKEAKSKSKEELPSTKKESVKEESKKPAVEMKKEQSSHAEKAAPPPKDIPGKDRGKSKNLGSGIKRLFTKKPPSQ